MPGLAKDAAAKIREMSEAIGIERILHSDQTAAIIQSTIDTALNVGIGELTAEAINALPEPIRRRIHDLETICDPAGMVQELADLREQRTALTAAIAEKDKEIEVLKADHDRDEEIKQHLSDLQAEAKFNKQAAGRKEK